MRTKRQMCAAPDGHPILMGGTYRQVQTQLVVDNMLVLSMGGTRGPEKMEPGTVQTRGAVYDFACSGGQRGTVQPRVAPHGRKELAEDHLRVVLHNPTQNSPVR